MIRRLARSTSGRPALAPLVAVLAVGLTLRIVYWYGLVNVDPYAYSDSAASIAHWKPGFDPEAVGNLYYTQYIRLSLTVPAALLYRLFGPGEVASTIVPIGASLGMGLIAFELARRVAGDAAGLIAAFLAVIFPLNVINSTQFLPDTMMAFFAGLTMLLFLQVTEEDLSPRSQTIRSFALGVAWSLAFYGRPTAIALAIPFAALFLFRRRFPFRLLWAVPGALLVVAAAQLLLVNLGSSFLQDLRTVLSEGRSSQPGALRYTDLDLSYIHDLLYDPMFIPTTFLAAAGVLAIIAKEGWRGFSRGRALPLVILVGGLYFYFEFLMRLPSLYSWWKEPRYVLSMLLPMFALAGIGLSGWIEMFRGGARRAALVYLAGALLFATAVTVSTVRNDHAYWQTHRIDILAREVSAFLDGQPDAPVFTWDDDFARYLSFHVGMNRTTAYERAHNEGAVRNRFAPDGRSLVEPGSFVVVNDAQATPGLATMPEPGWRVAWEKPGILKVYRVPAGGQ